MDAGDSIFFDFEEDNVVLCGDMFFKMMHISNRQNHRQLCRFGINTSFLSPIQSDERKTIKFESEDN
jgi:hypothetical protein